MAKRRTPTAGVHKKLYRQSHDELQAWLTEVNGFIQPFEQFCNELPHRLSVLRILEESVSGPELLQQLLLELAAMASRRPTDSQIRTELNKVQIKHGAAALNGWRTVAEKIRNLSHGDVTPERIETTAQHVAETIRTWLSPQYELRDAITYELQKRNQPRRALSARAISQRQRDDRLQALIESLAKENPHPTTTDLEPLAESDPVLASIRPRPKLTRNVYRKAIEKYHKVKRKSAQGPSRASEEKSQAVSPPKSSQMSVPARHGSGKNVH